VRYFYFLQRGNNEQGMSRALKEFKVVSFALSVTVLGVGSGSQVKSLEIGWVDRQIWHQVCQCLGTDNLD